MKQGMGLGGRGLRTAVVGLAFKLVEWNGMIGINLTLKFNGKVTNRYKERGRAFGLLVILATSIYGNKI
jgi:hypothetical protein